MGSHSYPKIIVESPFQTRNDEFQGSVFTSDGPRTSQWNILALFFNSIPSWWKFCGIQFFRIRNRDILLALPKFRADGNLNEVRGKLRMNGVHQLKIEAEDDERLDLFV